MWCGYQKGKIPWVKFDVYRANLRLDSSLVYKKAVKVGKLNRPGTSHNLNTISKFMKSESCSSLFQLLEPSFFPIYPFLCCYLIRNKQWGDVIIVLSMQGCCKEGNNPFSSSRVDKTRNNELQLQQRRSKSDIWKGFSYLKYWSPGSDCLRRLLSLCHWKSLQIA